jgi:Xaa-Pro aminopeptidase
MIRRPALIALLALTTSVAAAQPSQTELRQRRDSVLARTGDGIVLALGSPEPAEDFMSFFQNPSFAYLTGLREPEAALVMVRRGEERTQMLFVEPRDPAEEVWTGRRIGAAGVTQTMGLLGRDRGDLAQVMDSLLATGLPLQVIGDYSTRPRSTQSADDQLVRALTAKYASASIKSANAIVNDLRRRKSVAELDLLRKSIALTVEAQREAMRLIEPGMNEFEVQALVEYTFRRYGSDRPGFATIIGSGPNSTTLHYNADDRFMSGGEMVVMDIGAAYGGYSADVTRTVPVSGTFSADQRAIYQIVRSAQAAAESAAQPGTPRQAQSAAASKVLAEGLAKLGLIESPQATYQCGSGEQQRCSQLSLYYMHGLGHDIGLDVHDPNSGTVSVGSAFTIEPGLYVRANTIDIIPDLPANRAFREKIRPVVERYGNIGVRIEDDYIVTERGLEWVSRAPREIDEIEALMKVPFTGPAPRDPVKVEWYRGAGR